MSVTFLAGATSQSVDIFLKDSSSTVGAGLAGLVYNTASLTAYYRIGATGTATAIALATQTVGGAWSSGGFVEINATNTKGMYRLDIPDAVLASAALVTIYVQGAANLAPTPLRIDCRPVPVVTTLTNLPAIMPNWLTAAGIAASALDGKGDWNVGKTGYTLTQSFPANFSSTSITAGGVVKSDLTTIKTQTVTCASGVTILSSVGTAATSTAQTGDSFALANGANGFVAIDTVVDAIKVKTDFLPSATAGANGGVFIAGTNAATTVTGSLTTTFTGSLTGSVASVSGAVGSVTGAVGSVTGSVGSVVGHTPQTGDTFALANGASGFVAIAGYIDTEIGTLLNDLAAVLVDSGTTLDTKINAIKAVTDVLPDSGALSSLATAAALATVDTVVDAVKVVTDQMVFTTANQLDVQPISMASAAETSLADAILNRGASNIENTADRHSLGAVIMISTNSAISGASILAKKPSDDSTFATYVITSDAAADNLTGIS